MASSWKSSESDIVAWLENAFKQNLGRENKSVTIFVFSVMVCTRVNKQRNAL